MPDLVCARMLRPWTLELLGPREEARRHASSRIDESSVHRALRDTPLLPECRHSAFQKRMIFGTLISGGALRNLRYQPRGWKNLRERRLAGVSGVRNDQQAHLLPKDAALRD